MNHQDVADSVVNILMGLKFYSKLNPKIVASNLIFTQHRNLI